MARTRMVQVMAALVSISVFITLFAGCGGSKEPEKAADTPKQSTAAESKQEEKKAPVKLSIWMTQRADEPTDNEIYKILQEKTNTVLEWETAPEGNEREKFQLTMASGRLPDIMIFEQIYMRKYINDGAYEPLDELIKSNAPNLKKFVLDNAENKKFVSHTDGKVYFVPFCADQVVSEVFMVREDWLKKLGLNKPVTIDDWYAMLKAFREKDPNGNGNPNDEMPFINRQGRQKVIPLAMAWGIRQEEFFVEEDGKVKYGAADPRMKGALQWLRKLYAEKLLEQEFPVVSKAQWEQKATNSIGGAMHDWVNRTEEFTTALKTKVPEGQWTYVLPPVGPYGKSITSYQSPRLRDVGNAVITASSKRKVEAVKFWDYIFSEEGSKLMQFGIKDKHYTEDGSGNIKFTDLIMKNKDGKTPQVAMSSSGFQRNMPLGPADMRVPKALQRPDYYLKACQDYEKVIVPVYPQLPFTDQEAGVLKSKYTQIQTYSGEMLNKFILGTESIDAKWDEYVKKINDMGIEEVLKVHQAAYDRYKK